MSVEAKYFPAADGDADPVAAFALSRRTFVVGTGAAAIAIGFGGPAGNLFAQDAVTNAGITNYVTIEPTGKITILYAKAEMGQGVLTGLPIVIAEFMDANWDDVVIERAAGVGPLAGVQNTVASNSTYGQWNTLRTTGLQVRAVLLDNAARQLGVPVGELATEPSVVVHAASGRRLSYGQIVAAGVTVPSPLPAFNAAALAAATNPDNFRLIGRTDIVRKDVASKVDGTAVFGIDADPPGLLYAAMLRPPVQGESPVTVDDTAARAVPGVVQVVTTPDGVGVIAESYHAATRGVTALTPNVTWTNTAPARTFNSEQALTDGLARLAEGDLPAAFANAVRVETLTFQSNFVAHAAMEPINSTVLAREDGTFEVWVSAQTPGNVQASVRLAAGNNQAQVAVNVALLGGGFGRRIESEVTTDATYLAIAVRGRPVKLIWSRTDDLRFDPFRPLAVQRIDAGLDANNNIVAWRNRITTQTYVNNGATRTVTNFTANPTTDGITAGGSQHPYSFQQQFQYIFMPSGIKVGAWRAIGAAYQKWPIEAMLDRVAELRGEDAIAYRLSLLNPANFTGNAVAAAAAAARITEIARDMSGWTSYQATPGRALGFGYSNAVMSHTACVAEVSANAQTGAIEVHKVWIAIDCGIAILPKHVEAQMVSNVLFALSPTLFEYVPIVNGVPQVANFTNYRTIRQDEAPEIVVQVAPRGGAGTTPGGVGEAGIAPLLPAVAGAVRKALGGVHVGYVPMLPAKVLEAVAAARAPTTTA